MNASEIIKNIEAEQLKADAPEFRVGDTVKVMETRPLSATKRWRLVEIIEKAK